MSDPIYTRADFEGIYQWLIRHSGEIEDVLARPYELAGQNLPPDFFETCDRVAMDHAFNVFQPGGVLRPGEPTVYTLRDGSPIRIGDVILSEWGYTVTVVLDGDKAVGRLVCGPDHSCANITYALEGGSFLGNYE